MAERRVCWAVDVTIQDLGSIGELVGAVATVATLLYLAVQIRQSIIATRIQTALSWAQQKTHTTTLISQDTEINRRYWTGLEEPDSLDRDEYRHFESIVSGWLNSLETSFGLYGQGALPLTEWEGQAQTLDWIVTTPGFLRYWDKWGTMYPGEWREFVDSCVEEARARPTPISDAAQ